MLQRVQTAVREQYGAQLAKVERWSRFRSEESTKEWLQLLGPTAVVLSHQELLVDISRDILGNSLEAEQLLVVLLAMSVHDIGESVKGDIAAPDKTAADDKSEARVALQLIKTLPHAEEVASAYSQVVAGENAALHTLFKAIERTEYFLTGIHLFEQLEKRQDKPEKLWLMVARILAFDLPKVLEYAQMFPETIGKYLLARREIIDRMFVRAEWIVNDEFRENFHKSRAIFTANASFYR